MSPGFRTGLAVFQLVVGAACLVWGLRGPVIARSQAPLGIMFMLTGSVQLWDGVFANDTPVLVVYGLCFAAASVWFVRIMRASQKRTLELLRQRHADELNKLTRIDHN